MADTLDVEKSEEGKSEEVSDVNPSGRGPGGGSTLPSEDTSAEFEVVDRESAWITQWLDQVQDVGEIAVCEVTSSALSLSAMRSNADPMTLSPPKVLIDGGESSSVSGRSWVAKWLKLDGISHFPVCTPCSRLFRFGSKISYQSRGTILLSGKVSAVSNGIPSTADLTFALDVIEIDDPFLLSRKALAALKGKIDFCANTLPAE